MIQQIKGLLQIKEHIDEIKKKTEDYNKSISSMKDELNALKNEVRDVKSSHAELLKYLKDCMGSIDDVKEDFKKELYEFNLLKSHLQNKMLEKFEKELQHELKINLDSLKADSKSYDDAKKEFLSVAVKLNSLKEEINKFIEIGKSIKKEDFELSRYANEIFRADREKLELMKKIDTLERLIAKLRSTNRG